DWSVPVVWEPVPLSLWPMPEVQATQTGDGTEPSRKLVFSYFDPDLPPSPDTGFEGQDGTFYSLERAFEQNHIVLLHGYAGGGKTAMAAEFARWWRETGGSDGPVLFSSFQEHLPLGAALNKIGDAFPDASASDGRQWSVIASDRERQEVAL